MNARADREAKDSTEAEHRRKLLMAQIVLAEMKQLMAEQYLSTAPPGRLQRSFDLFEKRMSPPPPCVLPQGRALNPPLARVCSLPVADLAASLTVLSAAEANGTRRSATAAAADAGRDIDAGFGWGLSAADIEEALGLSRGSPSSADSGRERAVEEVRGVLLPVFEARVRMQSESLAAFCLPPSGKSGISYGWGAVETPKLQEKVDELADLKKQLHTKRAEALALVVRRLEAQLDALDLMARLLAEDKVSLQPKWDLPRKEFLLAFCEAQVLKVARLQSEIRVDTYTPQTTPALAKIRELVLAEKRQAEAERDSNQALLAEYEAAGPPMLQLAKQYATITKDIEDKAWALQKVREDC